MGGGGSERQKLARKTVDEKQEKVQSLRSFAATDLQFKLEKCKLGWQSFLNSSGLNLNCSHTSSQRLFAEPKKSCITTAGLCAKQQKISLNIFTLNSYVHLKSLAN